MQFIVTDLTRFATPANVCLAGIIPGVYTCVRPLPYFTLVEYKTLNILPGSILEMDLRKINPVGKPHIEDMGRDNQVLPRVVRPATTDEFEAVLKNTRFRSITEGFDNKVPTSQKYVPFQTPPDRSIITIQTSPNQVEIVRDIYNQGKIKLHFNDIDRNYSFLPITDLGFFSLAMSSGASPTQIADLNAFIKRQDKIYLRIGLSRVYAPNTSGDTRHGFWLQVNGIYTFPQFLTAIRTH